MTVTQRLAATFNVNGILIHRPRKQDFGAPLAGDVVATHCRPSPMTATGHELAESIRIAEAEVARWQEAIANMKAILDCGDPL